MYRPTENDSFRFAAPAPAKTFNYVSAVNEMLCRPAEAVEIVEASFRVNVDLRTYYSRNPMDITPLDRLPPGTRADIKWRIASLAESKTEICPKTALHMATCVAIMRGEAERLRPPRTPVLKAALR